MLVPVLVRMEDCTRRARTDKHTHRRPTIIGLPVHTVPQNSAGSFWRSFTALGAHQAAASKLLPVVVSRLAFRRSLLRAGGSDTVKCAVGCYLRALLSRNLLVVAIAVTVAVAVVGIRPVSWNSNQSVFEFFILQPTPMRAPYKPNWTRCHQHLWQLKQ